MIATGSHLRLAEMIRPVSGEPAGRPVGAGGAGPVGGNSSTRGAVPRGVLADEGRAALLAAPLARHRGLAAEVVEREPQTSREQAIASDLLHGDPPDQLADPFLTPEGATVLYGKGGVGKGVVACWLMLRLVRAGPPRDPDCPVLGAGRRLRVSAAHDRTHPGQHLEPLTKLEDAGLVRIEKSFVGQRPNTSASLTPVGKERTAAHWEQLDRLKGLAASSRDP